MKTTHRHTKVARAPRRRPPSPTVGDRYVPGHPGAIDGLGPFVELTVVRVNPNDTVNLTETDTVPGVATMHVGITTAVLTRLG